jgi:hypothetical protein
MTAGKSRAITMKGPVIAPSVARRSIHFALGETAELRGAGEYLPASKRECTSCCIRGEAFEQSFGKDPEPLLADALQPLFLNNS